VAYLEGASLKIKELASQALVAERPLLLGMRGGAAWSPTGRELCLAGRNDSDDRTGLWIYGLDRSEPARALSGQITVGSWAPDGSKLVFSLGPPYFEIWTADLDPSISTIEAIGSVQTPDEHVREMIAFHTRRTEADPQDAYAYSSRARYHDCLHDRARATADMRQWSAILTGSDFQAVNTRKARRIIDGPYGYQFVFSAERPVNEIPLLNVAFGQKGRCKMKSFQVPICSMSLLGLCLLSGLDTSVAYADSAFGEPVNVKEIIPALDQPHDECLTLSYDGLEMYFDSDRPGGHGVWDIWVLRRGSMDEDWGPPENIGFVVNGDGAAGPSISYDGLTLYFSSNRLAGHGSMDIYMATRTTRNDVWGQVVNLGPKVNSPDFESMPGISSDGLELYFQSNRPGGYGGFDIYVSRRATENDPWGDAVNLGPVVNSAYNDAGPSLSPDGLLLFFQDFSTPRPGGYGGTDLWMARRTSLSDPWGLPANLGSRVNGPTSASQPRVSPDGSTLYFGIRDGGNRQASIIPIVDFNGDGTVDGKDLLCMAAQWSTDDPLCDIGPHAWGDGIVDLQDVVALSEYIGKEVIDSTLVAHWALDEAEGTTALDSAGSNIGYVMGDPVWQPDAGQVNGALQLDGVDDVIVAGAPLNPAEGSFSILAWVKGGGPGQVIVSQVMGANCLMLDTEGRLMTELMSPTRSGSPLLSETTIDDGQWHRVALIWDGMQRKLCVDNATVAEDIQDGLGGSGNGMYIGTGKAMEPGTFWSGLIDDVRIYNRAVHP
jgi:Tol biopolymer transport system component